MVAGNLDQAGLGTLEAELNLTGQNVWTKAGDLRSKDYCEDLIEYSVQATGRLDMLVNNAGIITRGNILTTTGEDWERTFEISVCSIVDTSRKAMGHMKRHGGGAFVNVACYGDTIPGLGTPRTGSAKKPWRRFQNVSAATRQVTGRGSTRCAPVKSTRRRCVPALSGQATTRTQPPRRSTAQCL
ncbi:MAG: SDR family NAD(P)-dependent oxidoreductase [Mesorhizobium sp.]|nr:MAG: SDR family NAD(P)-dependent oxidoreductase [Mesorhizobium sp.]RWN15099.1 MAG: SDR family NAD(P)-dependent oxidoreductase [Mesorhizobium sp.]RWN20986.1 MAG: SDR family NAD(P)-dependent oxidoreductase [Mesorhizobium sp.]